MVTTRNLSLLQSFTTRQIKFITNWPDLSCHIRPTEHRFGTRLNLNSRMLYLMCLNSFILQLIWQSLRIMRCTWLRNCSQTRFHLSKLSRSSPTRMSSIHKEITTKTKIPQVKLLSVSKAFLQTAKSSLTTRIRSRILLRLLDLVWSITSPISSQPSKMKTMRTLMRNS